MAMKCKTNSPGLMVTSEPTREALNYQAACHPILPSTALLHVQYSQSWWEMKSDIVDTSSNLCIVILICQV